MRKLLGSTLALAMMFSSAPAFSAELFKNLTWSGQIDLQATSARNISDFVTRGDAATTNNDRLGDAQTRIMVTMMADLLDDVHGTVTIRKNDRSYGTSGGNSFGDANSQPVITGGGTGVMNNIFVDQAFFKIDKIGDSVDASFGRQFFGQPGDLIIYFGPSDKAWYGLPVAAIDAARFDWANDQHSVSALVGKTTGRAVGNTTTDDIDLRGVTAACKGENHNVGAYLWNVVQHRSGALGSDPTVVTSGASNGGKNTNLYIVGVKGKVEMGSAFVKGEVAKNFGVERQGVNLSAGEDHSARNFTGHAIMVKGGANLELGGIGKVTPWVQGALGTGRRDARSNKNEGFQSVNSDFRPGVIVGRFAGSPGSTELGSSIGGGGQAGIENRVIYGVGVKVTPEAVNKLTVGASVLSFNTETNATPTLEGREANFGGNKHLGNEYAVEATWKHSDNVSMTGAVGTFQPGGLIRAMRNATNDHRNNPATMAAFDVRVKWGAGGSSTGKGS